MIKVQEEIILKYLNLQICQYPLGFSVDQTDHIIELVNEWFITGKFRKVDTPFREDSTYEKELMTALTLTKNVCIRNKWNIMENLDILLDRYNTLLVCV